MKDGSSSNVAAWFVGFVRDEKTPGPRDLGNRWFLLTASFWMLVCFSLLVLPHYQYAWPGTWPSWLSRVRDPYPFLLWSVGFLSLVVLNRRMASYAVTADPVGKWTGRLLLAAILGLAVWLRFCHYDLPTGPYWDDQAEEIIDPVNVEAFSDYRWIYSLGAREPLYTFYAAAWVHFLPKTPLFIIHHLVNASLDMVTVWLLYHLGKELAGRPGGLTAAAVGAISKALLFKALIGHRYTTVPLAICLALIFFFRVIKKPTRAHWVQWAFATALGTYLHTVLRPWALFLPIVLLAWILLHPEERFFAFWRWLLAFALVGFLTVIGLFSSGYLDFKIFQWMTSAGPLILLGGGFAGLFAINAVIHKFEKRGTRLLDWSLAVLLLLALMMPMLSQMSVVERMTHLTLGQAPGVQPTLWNSLATLGESLGRTGKALFVSGWDRGDMGRRPDAFLGLPEAALFFLGLAALLARPSWKLLFLLALIPIGAAAYILSTDSHTGKMLGAVVPLLAIGAWGSVRWWGTVRLLAPGRLGRALPGLLLLAGLGWGAWANYRVVYDLWDLSPQYRNVNVALALQAEKDYRDHQVFLPPFCCYFYATGPAQDVLEDGRDVRVLRDVNYVIRQPDSPRQAVAIYCHCSQKELMQRLRAEYPGAEWNGICEGVWKPDEEPFPIWRVRIPFGQISKEPGRIFQWVDFREDRWVRKYSRHRCGLGRGIFQWKDQVASLYDPWPPQVAEDITGVINGRFLCVTSGMYEFKSDMHKNFVVLAVDGKKVFDVRPKQFLTASGFGRLPLEAGPHPVEVRVRFWGGQDVPLLYYRQVGSLVWRKLDGT